jgi:ribosomal protein S20
MFSGSYLKSDVEFLLKILKFEETDVSEKELNIQTGKKHYSEMLSPEYIPTKEYLDIFYHILEKNKTKFASDILKFSQAFFHKVKSLNQQNSTIVSLARAGTPIGVLVKRTLESIFDFKIKHYSVSIVRDREIDQNAIKHILKFHKPEEIFFLDGWTGKGVIGRELKKSIQEFNIKNKTDISPDLYVITDISGKADFSVTNEDYMIPSSGLNSTISGLVSRTILNYNYLSKDDFHGCKFYSEFKNSDLSLWFIDEVLSEIKKIAKKIDLSEEIKFIEQNKTLESDIENFIKKTQKEYLIQDVNHIKPGIAETTRVLLRRVPDLILIKNRNENISHLEKLAIEKNCKIKIVENLPFNAVGIIKNLKKELNN